MRSVGIYNFLHGHKYKQKYSYFLSFHILKSVKREKKKYLNREGKNKMFEKKLSSFFFTSARTPSYNYSNTVIS